MKYIRCVFAACAVFAVLLFNSCSEESILNGLLSPIPSDDIIPTAQNDFMPDMDKFTAISTTNVPFVTQAPELPHIPDSPYITAIYSADDWTVCGAMPWYRSGDFDKIFGKKRWAAGQGHDGVGYVYYTQSECDFGTVGFRGYNYKDEKEMTISVYIPDSIIGIPRRLDIGTPVAKISESYLLGESDADGYYYGGAENYPSAAREDVIHIEYNEYAFHYIIFTDIIVTPDKPDEKWLCIIRYKIENEIVVRIIFNAFLPE